MSNRQQGTGTSSPNGASTNAPMTNAPPPGGPRRGPGGFGGGPGGPHMGPVQKAKDFKGTLRRLLVYLKPFQLQLVIVLIFAILSTVFAIYAPQVSRQAMNELQDAYVAKTVLTQLENVQNNIRGAVGAEMMGLTGTAAPQTGEKTPATPSTSAVAPSPPTEAPSPEAMQAMREFLSLPDRKSVV